MTMADELSFGARGANVRIYPHVVIVSPERVFLQSEIIISEFAWIHGGIRTLVGSFIHVSPFSSIAGGGACILEDFVGLSAGVRIITGSELVRGEGLTNPTIPPQYRAVSRSFVHCERHAFLGTDAVVHPGVTVGEGAVVGSNAVVTKDVEPWTVNVGAPARPVGKRDRDKMLRLAERLYRERSVAPTDVTEWLTLKTTTSFVPDE